MKTRVHTRRAALSGLLLLLFTSSAFGQDLTIPEELKARIAEWAPNAVRENGTEPEDWRYELPEGITTKQVTYYSDDTACYAKMFYPKDFDPSKKYPGVVLGHGTNAISIALEKYGAVFAAHGIVAMAIDYRGYGFSDGWVMLDEEDTTTDEQRITEKTARVVLKRTRLLTPKQVEDYRNAISYLQGEPGVDPDKIGLWGSSLSGGTAVATAGLDARVKAVVAQVPAVRGGGSKSSPLRMRDEALEDAIERARTGQGGERDAGFSIRTKVDTETRTRNREINTSALMERIPKTTAILFLPGEKDTLTRPAGAQAAHDYLKGRGVITEVVIIPYITHFQAYTGPAFEATSTLAARWFAHHLATTSTAGP